MYDTSPAGTVLIVKPNKLNVYPPGEN